MTDEDLKVLFDVRDGGAIETKRYGHIQFPVSTPRLFSFNETARAFFGVKGDPSRSRSHVQEILKRVCVAGFRDLVSTPIISQQLVDTLERRFNEELQVDAEVDP